MRIETRQEYDAADERWSDLYFKYSVKADISDAELTEMHQIEAALDEYEIREGLVDDEETEHCN